MTEDKRFEIKQSVMDNNRYVIHDSKKEYTFPVLDSTLNYMFCKALNELSDENEHYKSIFFELIETALRDKNCRELYCKGILDIFNKANSLNQAREMIKEHLE